jgi:hypothetical protein
MCSFRPHGNGDFDIATTVTGQGRVFASVYVQNPHQLAGGLWGYQGKPTGALYANGPCWENASIRVCAWGQGQLAQLPPRLAAFAPPPVAYATPPAVYAALPPPQPAPVYTPPSAPAYAPPPPPPVVYAPPAPPAAPPAPVAAPAPAYVPPVAPTPPVATPATQPKRVIGIDIGPDGHSMHTRVRFGSGTYVTALVDTGASYSSIPVSMINDLIAKGEATYLGSGTFKLADGSRHEELVVNIREVQVGGAILHDVAASTSPDGSDVLLGMSALDQLGTMTIDKAHGQLLFS